MVHVPAARRLTEVPETVHTAVVREEKVTASPDEALADGVNGD